MNRSLLLLASLLLPAVALAAPDQNGAVAAMRALPAQYQSGILRLSADHGKPTPPYWAIIARNPSRRGLPTSLTVTRGRVTSERATLNPRALISGDSPITLSRVRIDSPEAWRRAKKFASDRGRRLDSVSYVLQQRGSTASAVWSIWCYDSRGGYIGFVSLLATTGTIISTD
jgi:hypothetical protein